MATIIDNLNTIVGIKEDIRNAIADKGVDMVDVPFSEFPDKIATIETGGGGGDDGYIDVGELGLKVGNSTFTEVPEIFDFSNVTDMCHMFYNCSKLQTIPELDTSNVTYMNSMFISCISLQTIPELNTSNVTNMNRMFGVCESLQSIPLIDTSNVTDMNGMFLSCSKLQTIPELDTSNVKDMGSMFNSCVNLISLPSLNAAKVNSIIYYFGPTILENLTDVGGWIGLKIHWNDNFGLAKCPNLTYQSCINILNGLADVTELGGGTLKVHPNFLTTVGDEISIGINKGWTISA